MYKKSLAILVILMALPAPVLAGTKLNNTGLQQANSLKTGETAAPQNAAKKSDRQKCLDKLLPQDGVDCLKKLKAKEK